MSWGNHTGGGRMSCCEWRSTCTTLLHFTFNPAWWHRSATALSIPTLLSCLHASSIPQVSPILPGVGERLWSEDAASLPQALRGKWGVRSQQWEVLPPAAQELQKPMHSLGVWMVCELWDKHRLQDGKTEKPQCPEEQLSLSTRRIIWVEFLYPYLSMFLLSLENLSRVMLFHSYFPNLAFLTSSQLLGFQSHRFTLFCLAWYLSLLSSCCCDPHFEACSSDLITSTADQFSQSDAGSKCAPAFVLQLGPEMFVHAWASALFR